MLGTVAKQLGRGFDSRSAQIFVLPIDFFFSLYVYACDINVCNLCRAKGISTFQNTVSLPLAQQRDFATVCICYQLYNGESSEELFYLNLTADFHYYTNT